MVVRRVVVVVEGLLRCDPAKVLHDRSNGFLEVERAEMYALHFGKVSVQYGGDHLCGEGDSVPLDGCVIRLLEPSISVWSSAEPLSSP